MLPVPEFYAKSRWGDVWNELRPNGSRHRGHDIVTGSRNEVPALYPGRVASLGYTRVLGFYVVVKTAHGYDFYCHLLDKDRAGLGRDLKQGVKVGTTATWGDVTGTAWTGPHLHYGSGPRITSVTAGTTHNATALVAAALSATAGGGTTPLPNKRKDTDMPAVIKRATDTPEWSLIWPPLRGTSDLERGYEVTTDPERAKWWARFYELGQGTEDVFERDDYVKAQEFARLDHAAWLRGQAAQSFPTKITGTLS